MTTRLAESFGSLLALPRSLGRMRPRRARHGHRHAGLDQAMFRIQPAHEGLGRHMHNAIAVEKPGGVQIAKPKSAPRDGSPVGRIDAAVASIMAFDSACLAAGRPPEATSPVFAF